MFCDIWWNLVTFSFETSKLIRHFWLSFAENIWMLLLCLQLISYNKKNLATLMFQTWCFLHFFQLRLDTVKLIYSWNQGWTFLFQVVCRPKSSKYSWTKLRIENFAGDPACNVEAYVSGTLMHLFVQNAQTEIMAQYDQPVLANLILILVFSLISQWRVEAPKNN